MYSGSKVIYKNIHKYSQQRRKFHKAHLEENYLLSILSEKNIILAKALKSKVKLTLNTSMHQNS